jgi:hypothetical protein
MSSLEDTSSSGEWRMNIGLLRRVSSGDGFFKLNGASSLLPL